MTLNRVIAVLFLLLASTWVALVNGQPIFMGDTTAYVREPDFAIVYFLGPKFATSWTQNRTLQGVGGAARQPTSTGGTYRIRLNSPFDKAAIAGRSIYYGLLLYLGHLTSDFWLSILTQAALFLYLIHTLVVKCFRLSFDIFTWTTLAVLVASPVSFFISALMPDIFASFLILSTIIVLVFWNALALRDKVIVCTIICFSALAHTSHLILLICLSLTFTFAAFLIRRKITAFGSVTERAAVLFALVLIAFGGQFAFLYAARLAIGVNPIQPPFLMARLIADGPGYEFLKKNCSTDRYIVCKYLDRLPNPVDTFLWSKDPNKGVFAIADLDTRKTLAAEQMWFAIDVMKSYPIAVIANATTNTFRQLFLKIGLNELFVHERTLGDFEARLPAPYFSRLLRSRIIRDDEILSPINAWYALTYYASAICLILILIVAALSRNHDTLKRFYTPQLVYAAWIALTGTVFNAGITGALSEPSPRYQARVLWVCVFLAILTAANLLKTVFAEQSSKDI